MSSTEAKKVVGARPYRAFLTASLHRRFMNAAVYTGAACFILSLLLNEAHSMTLSRYFFVDYSLTPEVVWSWFPIGPAGIYTGALFLCTLLVDFIRVSNLRSE